MPEFDLGRQDDGGGIEHVEHLFGGNAFGLMVEHAQDECRSRGLRSKRDKDAAPCLYLRLEGCGQGVCKEFRKWNRQNYVGIAHWFR